MIKHRPELRDRNSPLKTMRNAIRQRRRDLNRLVRIGKITQHQAALILTEYINKRQRMVKYEY